MNRYESYKDSGVEWIGQIPSHWDVKPLKSFSEVELGKMLTTDDKGGMTLKPYLRSFNIQSDYLDLSDVSEMWFTDSELNRLRLKRGDVLLTEGGDVGRTSIWNDELKECYFQNSINRVRTLSDSPIYFKYLSNTYHQIGHYDSMVSRVSIPHLTKEKLESIRFPLPPLPEQEQIVSFLDEKTTKIDVLIKKKEQKIELLREYRTSLINRVITKGLNTDVPMKDSGVEWIGEIPSHWEVSKVKYQFDISGGGTPSTEKDEYWEGTIPWVSSKDMKSRYIYDTIDHITPLGLQNSTCSLVDVGSIIIVVRSGILQRTIPIGINKVPLVVNQDQKVLSSRGDVLEEFFYYFVSGNEISLLTDWMKEGTTVESIEMEYLENFPLHFPPLSEQEQIVSYLDGKTGEIDSTIDSEKKKIDLLKEYRQSLISSVITGKIKVVD